MRKQCAETYKKQCRMITYCLHQMLILQHASLFQICNAVTISSETKPLPFHTVAPNLHEKRCPSRSPFLQKYMHLLQKLELFFLFQVVSTCFVGPDMFDIPLKVTPYLILYTGKGYCMIFL